MRGQRFTYRQGERLTLGALLVERVTTYERPAWHKEGFDTCYRYALKAPTGELFVYSGRYLPCVKVGEYVDLKATIKRVEPEWNCVRIMRVKILALGKRELLI